MQEVMALKFINTLKKRFNSQIFFVHIRLTDQLIGCFKEASSVLPLAWFFTSVLRFSQLFTT